MVSLLKYPTAFETMRGVSDRIRNQKSSWRPSGPAIGPAAPLNRAARNVVENLKGMPRPYRPVKQQPTRSGPSASATLPAWQLEGCPIPDAEREVDGMHGLLLTLTKAQNRLVLSGHSEDVLRLVRARIAA